MTASHDRRRQRSVWVQPILGVVAVALLAMLVTLVWQGDQRRNQVEQQAQPLADQVRTVCASGGQGATELERVGACKQADVVKDSSPTTVTVTAAGPSDAQVRAAVAAYLRDNPPAPGRAPTDAEVDAAVTRVCAAISCQGEKGDPGKDGAGPSDEQVQAQVADYCGRNNGCRPTTAEVAAAVEAYCNSEGAPCRGIPGQPGEPGATGAPAPPPASYTERHQGMLGTTAEVCTRTTPPEDDTPEYDCVQQ